MKTFRALVYLVVALFMKISLVELLDTQEQDHSAPDTTKQTPGDSLLQEEHSILDYVLSILLNPWSGGGLMSSQTQHVPSVLPPQDAEPDSQSRAEPLMKTSRPPVYHIPFPALRSNVRSLDPSALCSFCAPDTFSQLPPTCKTVCGGHPTSAGDISGATSITSQLPFCIYCVETNVEPSCRRLCEESRAGVAPRGESLGVIAGDKGIVVGPGGIRVVPEGVELKPKGYILEYGDGHVADDLGLGLGDIVVAP